MATTARPRFDAGEKPSISHATNTATERFESMGQTGRDGVFKAAKFRTGEVSPEGREERSHGFDRTQRMQIQTNALDRTSPSMALPSDRDHLYAIDEKEPTSPRKKKDAALLKSFQRSFQLADVRRANNATNPSFSVQERTTLDNNLRDGWNKYIVDTNKHFFDANKLYLKSMQGYMTLEMPNRHGAKKPAGPKIAVQHNRRFRKRADQDANATAPDVPRMAAKIDSVSSLSRSESREDRIANKKAGAMTGAAAPKKGPSLSLAAQLTQKAVERKITGRISEEPSHVSQGRNSSSYRVGGK